MCSEEKPIKDASRSDSGVKVKDVRIFLIWLSSIVFHPDLFLYLGLPWTILMGVLGLKAYLRDQKT
jgi:hypothetical protein